jgi:hypothetical protein
MATMLMIVLIVGYAWSVWLLWRQMHFDEPASGAKGEIRAAVPKFGATARRRAFRKQLYG